MTDYLMDTWYQAGFTDEVPPGGKLARTICEVPLVFYRRPGGSLAALVDRCPHRFAPFRLAGWTATSTRRFRVDDEGFSQFLRGASAQAFVAEDKPMLESQQARIGQADFWSLQPVLLRIDAASTRARRLLERKIAGEAARRA